jgi:hypothetical protein
MNDGMIHRGLKEIAMVFSPSFLKYIMRPLGYAYRLTPSRYDTRWLERVWSSIDHHIDLLIFAR